MLLCLELNHLLLSAIHLIFPRHRASAVVADGVSLLQRFPVRRAHVLLLRLPLLHSAALGRLWHSRADPLRFRQMRRPTPATLSTLASASRACKFSFALHQLQQALLHFHLRKPHFCRGVPRLWHSFCFLEFFQPSAQPVSPDASRTERSIERFCRDSSSASVIMTVGISATSNASTRVIAGTARRTRGPESSIESWSGRSLGMASYLTW